MTFERKSRRSGQPAAPKSTGSGRCESNPTAQELGRRRAASRRMERMLCCPCRDPLGCDCHDGQPSEPMVDGYRDAVLHLDAHGLLAAPRIREMQVLWRRGGSDQRLVRNLAECWELAG